MFKKFLVAIGGFIVVVVSLGAIKVAQIKQMSSISHVPPPTAVTTAEARLAKWNTTIKAIGTLAPVEGVTLSADAEGTVVQVAVENGAAVQAGDLLVELDTSVEQAQLASAEARAALADISLGRAKDLFERNATAKSDFDAADATAKDAHASVNAIKAQIAKKQIRAPFSGRVGLRSINLGQFVPRGQAMIPLQKLDPIYANFSVPQRHLPSVLAGQPVSVEIDAFPGQSFQAKITAVDATVDSASRNISVQATLANPQDMLRSGMFARVEVQLPESESVVAVPATAVAYASYGNSVFIVENVKGADGQEYLGVRQQFVKLGATRGDLVAITEGLKPGEQVVTAGVFKLRNGAHVQVNNSAQPSSNPAPTPANT